MSMRCLPVTVGPHTLIIPMHWVIQVQQVQEELETPLAEGERSLPLLNMHAWLGVAQSTEKRFIIVIGSADHAICLLVDGVLPARTADAFSRLPQLIAQIESPFEALWEPDPTAPPLPVLNVTRLLQITADRSATL